MTKTRSNGFPEKQKTGEGEEARKGVLGHLRWITGERLVIMKEREEQRMKGMQERVKSRGWVRLN